MITGREVTYKGVTVRCDGFAWMVMGWYLYGRPTRHKTLKSAKAFIDRRLADRAEFGDDSGWSG